MADSDLVTVMGEFEFVSKTYGDGWAWGTLIAVQAGKKTPIKVVGTLDGFRRGSCVVVTGTWVEHPKYGRQIKAESVVHETPSTEDGVISWLTEHLPQIGPVRAQALVSTFGLELWDVIENTPDKLTVISGMTEERVEDLVAAYQRYRHTREQQASLYTNGYTQKEAHKIIRQFERQAAATGAQPHALYLFGLISFARAEFIGARVGIPQDDPKRVNAALLEYISQQGSTYGHTVFDEATLIEGASEMIDLRNRVALREGVYSLLKDQKLAALGGQIFMQPGAYESEMTIAWRIDDLLRLQAHKDEEELQNDSTRGSHADPEGGGAGASG